MSNTSESNDTKSVPAIDLQNVDTSSASPISQRNYEVRIPNEDWNEFVVEVRASVLRKIRNRLQKIIIHRFPWHELLLGLGPLFLGAVFGAISGDVKFELSVKGVIFYIVSPSAFIGLLIAYFFVRKIRSLNIGCEISSILEDIPNPEDTTRRHR